MNPRLIAFCIALILLGVCELNAQTRDWKPEEHIVTFDAPCAGSSFGQGTVPRSMNNMDEVTGEVYDSTEAVHGFVRAANGEITCFDVSGSSSANGQGTFPRGVNSFGEIVGFYYDANHLMTRGFIRDKGGMITTLDDGSLPMSINDRGQTTGTDSAHHGFVRDNDGTIVRFDVGPYGTFPQSITANGEVTGWYADAGFISHGFLRHRDGRITTFSVDHAFTVGVSINPRGEITGTYLDSKQLTRAFLRDEDGEITIFNVGHMNVTVASAINPRGEIAGDYWDSANLAHGFVRDRDGKMAFFDAPGAGGRFGGDGTDPQSINAGGDITGWYTDSGSAYHGFLRIRDRAHERDHEDQNNTDEDHGDHER